MIAPGSKRSVRKVLLQGKSGVPRCDWNSKARLPLIPRLGTTRVLTITVSANLETRVGLQPLNHDPPCAHRTTGN
jgi:hypothetical protein